MTCVLCEARETEKYRIVYEDDFVFVMINNSPIKDGHVMILPVRHIEHLHEASPEEAQALLTWTDKMMDIVEKVYGDAAMTLINGWTHRTQPHLHIHVLPSKKNVRTLYVAAEGVEERVMATQEQMKKMTEEIQAHL